MDGIALELWNKKLILLRYKRLSAFKSCLDGSRIKGHFHNPILLSELFQLGADNLDVMILHWKETFQSSWQRQKTEDPEGEAEKGQTDVLAFLATEQKQIEGEIFSLGNDQGLSLKMEDLKDGKEVMHREASVLRASCVALIADLKFTRQEEIDVRRAQTKRRRRELWLMPVLLGIFVTAGSLSGVWLGANLREKYSTQDRQYLDQKLRAQSDTQRRISQELSALHRSSRKIAYWTEKSAQQIDQEMDEAKSSLAKEIADIREETARKAAMIESEYARSGRDGGVDLDRRKQGLFKLQEKQISEAQGRTRRRLSDLEEQKNNIQR